MDHPLSMLSFLQHIYLYNYVICKWCLLKNGAHEVRKLKIEYEKKDIAVKHNFNNSGAIVLKILHNLNPLVRH
jgi:hypothetical protein